MNETSIWSQIYPYILLAVCLVISWLPFFPEPLIWLWRRLKKSTEMPMDFRSIHEERKAVWHERRTKRRERRQERVGRRGRLIE